MEEVKIIIRDESYPLISQLIYTTGIKSKKDFSNKMGIDYRRFNNRNLQLIDLYNIADFFNINRIYIGYLNIKTKEEFESLRRIEREVILNEIKRRKTI